MHSHSTPQTTFAKNAAVAHYNATGQHEDTLQAGNFNVHYTYKEDHEGDYLFIEIDELEATGRDGARRCYVSIYEL